jgi:hypothetical protein
MYRFFEEEGKRQSNIEDITRKALPLLKEKSSPDKVDDDWITNFFDKCRIVSDEDMQQLWSKVLAGEANTPGAFSRRTINLMADLDKGDAELFARLCGYGWAIHNSVFPLIFDTNSEVYARTGIHLWQLTHLESLGLIQLDSFGGFSYSRMPKRTTVFYYGRPVELTFAQDGENQLEIGKVLLTRAGHELVRVCDSAPVDGFFDYVYDRWAAQTLVPKRETEPGSPPTS